MIRALFFTLITLQLSISLSFHRAFATEATCRSPQAIDEANDIEVEGAKLHLLVRGERCDLPIMIWLHGGPGGAETPLFRLYDSALEKRYLVAYWDQRGAGRSFDPTADRSRLTVAQHLADLDRIVDHLRARFNREKIALVGHSWGSALGLLYASIYPQKTSVFVGVNQFVSGLGAQFGKYEFAVAEAELRHDEDGKKKLAQLGPPPLNAKDELRLQSLVDRYGGYFHQKPSFLMAILNGTLNGYAMPWEIPTFIHANEVTLDTMQNEILALDLRDRITSVEVPVVFMLGRYDHQLDATQAVDYFKSLVASRKRLIWFENSAHNIPFEQPEEFVLKIREVLG